MRSKMFCLAAAIMACLLYPPPILTAAEYTVGGDGSGPNYYASLEDLRLSNRLVNRDVIVLNGDDSSLIAPFANLLNITIKGHGSISSASPSGFFYNPNNTDNSLTLDSDSLEFSNFNSTDSGGVIYARTVNIRGTNTFSSNSAATNGGAIYCNYITIANGTNTFTDNSASNYGGAICSRSHTTGGTFIHVGGTVTISGGENTFTDNSAIQGGAIYADTGSKDYIVFISGGTNTFTGNEATVYSGGAIFSSGGLTISGGTNTFIDNSANGFGGAIYNTGGLTTNPGVITILSGENTFSGNSANGSGGAINGINITFHGGTNTFSGNSVGRNGGAIHGGFISITGGTNIFTNNSAMADTLWGNGGAICGYNRVTISGGTNTFTGNLASGNGGAIYAPNSSATDGVGPSFQATNGDFTFRGNRDNVGTDSEKANAIYVSSATNSRGVTFSARNGQNIFFYDPVTMNATFTQRVPVPPFDLWNPTYIDETVASNIPISINPGIADTGTIVFDGSDYTRDIDRHSEVYGRTTVGYGTLALKGNVIYGAADDIGSFTLNNRATLTADEAMNQIWANTITLNGTVDIANSGTLLLSAAQGAVFGGR